MNTSNKPTPNESYNQWLAEQNISLEVPEYNTVTLQRRQEAIYRFLDECERRGREILEQQRRGQESGNSDKEVAA